VGRAARSVQGTGPHRAGDRPGPRAARHGLRRQWRDRRRRQGFRRPLPARRAHRGGPAYLEWFQRQGYEELYWPEHINEDEGDYLVVGGRLLAGTGFRTDQRSHFEAQESFRLPVASLQLVNPAYYHLDTALSVLSDDEVAYYPAAFSEGSQAVLRPMFPDAILAADDDAAVFGLNMLSDGRHVQLPKAATGLARQLAERGFEPIGVDLTELLKPGGSVKRCTLELRGRRRWTLTPTATS
jgi:N-dimethylarginine dimethylaminohydrolase